MKNLKTAGDLRELTDDELARTERDLRQEILNLRMQQENGQIENPIRLRLARREVARIKGIQRARQIAGSTVA
ncbi:MAG: 50S ribosomal protein L29 [Verrucomicrobiota bacterium]|jgi:large subunit ribosomal protein L29|nr:50S ribosomal protein L29 [Verrucomicrobiota bacterium]MDD8049723.1 50S ribosomal protein L29 [Verrucomicrobiota bacterium]MDI9385745.1 50S ribosomal protein L29 [Verrucomicrobiota bacterium]HCF95328.1 50S ribosomal protein L29 [Verrucomicrobiota bacterium]